MEYLNKDEVGVKWVTGTGSALKVMKPPLSGFISLFLFFFFFFFGRTPTSVKVGQKVAGNELLIK